MPPHFYTVPRIIENAEETLYTIKSEVLGNWGFILYRTA
jgi:hypothetical protein